MNSIFSSFLLVLVLNLVFRFSLNMNFGRKTSLTPSCTAIKDSSVSYSGYPFGCFTIVLMMHFLCIFIELYRWPYIYYSALSSTMKVEIIYMVVVWVL